METAVKLTVTLKTSETKQFIKACDINNSTVTLTSLHANCAALQSEVNGFLTTLVEKERSVSNVNSDSKMDESIEDEESSEDDEEEEECSVNSNGPQAKRLKQ